MKISLIKSISLIFLVSLATIFTGCGSSLSPSKGAKEPTIDPSLPTVKEIRTICDVKSIALEWDVINDKNIKGYFIYRGTSEDTKLKRVQTISDRDSNHFVDKELQPSTIYYYQIATFDEDMDESMVPITLKTSTLKMLESTPFVEAITNMPRKVKIIWRPHPDKSVDGYIIEKSDRSKSKWTKIATLNNRMTAEYIDKNLSDDIIYSYRIISRTFDGIESNPSDVVEAKTKPLPLPVLEIKATTSLPKKIVLSWLASTQDKDYYRVYRATKSDGRYEPIVKLYETTYTDTQERNEPLEDGKAYYYKVTVVDVDGLESRITEYPTIGKSLEKPVGPTIKEITVNENKATIKWIPNDERTKSYIVRRSSKKGFAKDDKQDFQTKNTTFTDETIVAGEKYTYQILAVDANNLISAPSEGYDISIPSMAK